MGIRYQMNRKLMSLGRDSMIKDEHGNDVYFVDGAAVSLGRRLTIKDLQGQELAKIHQQLIALTPTFEIETHAGLQAHVSMKLLSLTDRLKINLSNGEELLARGNLFHHEYSIESHGQALAHISKAWVSLTDSYGIDINGEKDQILLLACAVVIDEILEMREREEHSS